VETSDQEKFEQRRKQNERGGLVERMLSHQKPQAEETAQLQNSKRIYLAYNLAYHTIHTSFDDEAFLETERQFDILLLSHFEHGEWHDHQVGLSLLKMVIGS